MRALVIGASGLVGAALLEALGPDAVGTYRTRPRTGLVQLDASDASAVKRIVVEVEPMVIFVPAAQPNVEWCEREPDAARVANLAPVRGTLAGAGRVAVVGFSSDYVFDGADGPYREGNERRPLSAYGRIKVELEDLLLADGHTVVRTTTVFGPEPAPAKNFVVRLIASLGRGERVRVPEDQISTPTYATDLAAATVRIASLDRAARGIWHLAGPDLMARHELAYLVADTFGLDRSNIDPVPTAALGQVAARPLNGGLRCDRYEERWRAPGRSIRAALEDLRARLPSVADRT